MSELPWVRFFPSDWLGGTRSMSAAETGIYITLIATMYERGEPIPIDTARMARLCGASNSTFKVALKALIDDGKIIETEKGLWNERVQKEVVYRLEKSQVGLQAANARWSRKDNEIKDASDANAMPSQSERNANQKPEPDIDNTPIVPKGTRRLKSVDPKVYSEFEELVWKEFPRHPNSRKEPAFKKYQGLTPEQRSRCIGGAARYSIRFEETVDQKRTVEERLNYVPHLVTWINQKGWESEYDS